MSARRTEEWLANHMAKRAAQKSVLNRCEQDNRDNCGTSIEQLSAHPRKSYNFTVFGVCQPAGSKQAYVPLHPKTKEPYRNKHGGIVVSVVDDNRKSRLWKQHVALIAREECGTPLLEGPLRLTLTIYRERPKSHLAAVGLNKQGRETPFPITKPDSGKLARGTIDALTGILYKDDAQIVEDFTYKRYGSPARVEITVEELLVNDPDEQPVLFEEVPPWEK